MNFIAFWLIQSFDNSFGCKENKFQDKTSKYLDDLIIHHLGVFIEATHAKLDRLAYMNHTIFLQSGFCTAGITHINLLTIQQCFQLQIYIYSLTIVKNLKIIKTNDFHSYTHTQYFPANQFFVIFYKISVNNFQKFTKNGNRQFTVSLGWLHS